MLGVQSGRHERHRRASSAGGGRDAPLRLYGRRLDRAEARQVGSMSPAPTKKHIAPRNVPALASDRSIRVSVLGNTKLAIADAMKATEPSMLSHTIDQASSRNCGRQNPTPRAEIAYALATRNRTEPKKSGRQTCLSASAALRLCTVAANVLMLKKSVPGNCVAAASQFLSRGRQAHSRAWMRVCWRCSSTPVIPGLCACTNWQYDADVKKIDPTKKVMASAFAPTACTYAGIAPRAKQDAPSMNSEAMAEFRRAGSARTLTQRPEHAECVRGAAYGLGVDRLQVVTPVRLLYRLGREVGSCLLAFVAEPLKTSFPGET